MNGFDTKMYWKDKEIWKKRAQEHYEYIEDSARFVTECSIDGTEIIEKATPCERHGAETEVILVNMDTVTAIARFCKGRTTVLNFASYKTPGGKYLEGSRAQEECLCHASNLYPVLKAFDDNYYEWNRKHLNLGYYHNRALYSPSIWFNAEQAYYPCDVITCAAPNKTVVSKYRPDDLDKNDSILEDRIRFVMDIASEKLADTLILGAYGCGVFGQDARKVGQIFRQYLAEHPDTFKRVVFAIPGGNNLVRFAEGLYYEKKQKEAEDEKVKKAKALADIEKKEKEEYKRLKAKFEGI